MKILIAVQDTSILRLSKEFLSELRSSEDTKAVILHVTDTPPYGYYASPDVQKHVMNSARRMMDSFVEELRHAVPNINFEGAVIEGDPKTEIIRYAEQLPADLILMGSHGRGILGRVLLGSVSLAVQATAPCSVVILRDRHEDQIRKAESKQATLAGALESK